MIHALPVQNQTQRQRRTRWYSRVISSQSSVHPSHPVAHANLLLRRFRRSRFTIIRFPTYVRSFVPFLRINPCIYYVIHTSNVRKSSLARKHRLRDSIRCPFATRTINVNASIDIKEALRRTNDRKSAIVFKIMALPL